VNLAEVVIGEVQRYGLLVILELLAEGVCQPSESANVHSHREILTLDVGFANGIGVRVSANHDWDRLQNLSGRIALFAFTRGGINLDELGEVAAIREVEIHMSNANVSTERPIKKRGGNNTRLLLESIGTSEIAVERLIWIEVLSS
jgi:hypothetical protein